MSIVAQTKRYVKTAVAFVKQRPALVLALVFCSYLTFTAYYMYPVFKDINHTTYGFGDNTAGPIWKFTVTDGPLGGFQQVSNYPNGEDLYSPVWFSTLLQSFPLWLLSQIFSPVAAYNLFNIVGFLSTALLMFGLVNYITKGKKWVAWLAGYAVAFSPYFQSKIGGHPSYGYASFLIGIIWLFLLAVGPTRRRLYAVLLGLLAGATLYFDPYFTLFAGILLASLGVAWCVWRFFLHRRSNSAVEVAETKGAFKNICIAAAVTVLLALPLLGLRIFKSAEINEQVAAARGNVLAEAKACSNLPHEYFLPFVLHPGYRNIIGEDRYTKTINTLGEGFSCGIGEDSVGLSWPLLGLVGAGGVIVVWELLNKRRLPKTLFAQSNGYLIVSFVVVGLVAMVFALPPVMFHGLPTPSRLLLELTSTWRTLARFYLLVNISVVLLASLALVYFGKVFDKINMRSLKKVIFVGIAAFLFFEYQAFPPLRGNVLGTFNYQKNAPAVYTWLKEQDTIQQIAEYPLERYGGESDAMSYYLTMQQIHGKALFNSALSYSKDEVLKSGLKDLSDPQTVGVLKALGIDAVVVHGVDPQELQSIPGTELVFSAKPAQFSLGPHSPMIKNNDVVSVLRLMEQEDKASSLIVLHSGFVRNTEIIQSVVSWDYEALNGAVLGVTDLKGSTLVRPANVCFDLKMASLGDVDEVVIKVDGVPQKTMLIGDSYQRVVVSNVLRDTAVTNVSTHNMRVRNIGCNPGEV